MIFLIIYLYFDEGLSNVSYIYIYIYIYIHIYIYIYIYIYIFFFELDIIECILQYNHTPL